MFPTTITRYGTYADGQFVEGKTKSGKLMWAPFMLTAGSAFQTMLKDPDTIRTYGWLPIGDFQPTTEVTIEFAPTTNTEATIITPETLIKNPSEFNLKNRNILAGYISENSGEAWALWVTHEGFTSAASLRCHKDQSGKPVSPYATVTAKVDPQDVMDAVLSQNPDGDYVKDWKEDPDFMGGGFTKATIEVPFFSSRLEGPAKKRAVDEMVRIMKKAKEKWDKRHSYAEVTRKERMADVNITVSKGQVYVNNRSGGLVTIRNYSAPDADITGPNFGKFKFIAA